MFQSLVGIEEIKSYFFNNKNAPPIADQCGENAIVEHIVNKLHLSRLFEVTNELSGAKLEWGVCHLKGHRP